MTNSKEKQELTERISVRFKQFREAISKEFGFSFAEFCTEIGIPEEKFKTYEKGDFWPDFADLQKIGLNTGVNLNWLVYRNGGMFGVREKDMEEMLQKIEADEQGRYVDYKMLLKLMQVPEMEDLIFGMQKVFLNFLSTSDFASRLKEPGELEKLLPKIPTEPKEGQ
ncbi:MAG: hypothetical protein KAW12_12970 [Candidatus Aminicenantes bacterium]|nr:hypothetical protein [Candidatus Aminicenantes bacterium]